MTPNKQSILTSQGFGTPDGLPELSADEIAKLLSPTPTVQKFHGLIMASAPLGPDQALVHIYNGLPKGAKISDLINAAAQAASEMTEPLAKSVPTSAPSPVIFQAIEELKALPQRHVLSSLPAALEDAGITGIIAVAPINDSKIGRLHYLKPDYSNFKDKLKINLQAKLVGALSEFDLDLLGEQLGGKQAHIILPKTTERAIAVIAVDLSDQNAAILNDAIGLLSFLNPNDVKRARNIRRWFRGIGGVVLASAIGYLAVPSPVYVSNFAIAEASRPTTLALAFPAFLSQSYVQPGQDIKAGDLLVELNSPQIETAVAEQRVSINLERINAQEALETGNISDLQLAERRAQISELRLSQLEDQLAEMRVIAPADGRVVTALSERERGAFIQEGMEILKLQSDLNFDVRIDVVPRDASRLEAGQSGKVSFRGLGSEEYAIITKGAPIQTADPQTGNIQLLIMAEIQDGPHPELIVGLEGYARIETGRAIRAFNLSRQFIEYLRTVTWKYLGFTF